MEKITFTKPTRKAVAKMVGITVVAVFTVYGTVAAYNAAAAFTHRELDSYALNRVKSDSSLNAQLTATVVKVPVIDPAATSQLETTLKNAASQGAADGADSAIKSQLKQ